MENPFLNWQKLRIGVTFFEKSAKKNWEAAIEQKINVIRKILCWNLENIQERPKGHGAKRVCSASLYNKVMLVF